MNTLIIKDKAFISRHHLFQMNSAEPTLKLYNMSQVQISLTMASVTMQDANVFRIFLVNLFQIFVPFQSWDPRTT